MNNDLGLNQCQESVEKFDCPASLMKMKQKLNIMREHTLVYKREITNLHNEIKLFETMFDKYLAKIAKQQAETKTNKKPSGFAAPVKISNELSEFMGKNADELVPRTEVTKFVNKYIKDNQLLDSEDKTVIKPDSRLHKLLGTTDSDVVKYFTIQKFLNRHFVK